MDTKAIDLFEMFIHKSEKIRSFQLNQSQLSLRLQFIENDIRSQFDKNFKPTIKKKNIKKDIGQDFVRAIKSLTRQQKIIYYNKCADYIYSVLKGTNLPQFKKSPFEGQGFTRSFNLKIWKLKKIKFDRRKNYLYAQKQGVIKMYKLNEYVCRQSKNKQYYCFVLESTENLHEQFKSVHIGFKDRANFEVVYRNIIAGIDEQTYKFVKKNINVPHIQRMNSEPILNNIQKSKSQSSQKLLVRDLTQLLNKNSLPKSNQCQKMVFPSTASLNNKFLVKKQQIQQFNDKISLIQQDIDIQEQAIISQRHKVDRIQLVHKLILDQKLNLIYEYDYCEFLQGGSNWVIHKNNHKKNNVKMKIKFTQAYNKQNVISLLTNTNQIKKINKQIEQIEIKTLFSSQNSSLIYQKNRGFNKLYRARDFIFIRHICVQDNTIYIIDKSIEQIQFPPFMTIVRGNFKIMWAIQFTKQSTVKQVLIDATIENQGYLNAGQDLNLSLKYLKGFIELQQTLRNYKSKLIVYSLNWLLPSKLRSQRKLSQISKAIKKRSEHTNQLVQKKTIQLKRQINVEQSQLKNVNAESPEKNEQNAEFEKDHQQEQNFVVTQKQIKNQLEIMALEGQLNPEQLKFQNPIVPQRDNEGKIIKSSKFIKNKYLISPKNSQSKKFQEKYEGIHHPVWKGQWKQDQTGGIIFTNQKKLQDQKGVLKFVIGQIGKNLLAGKSILSISLPVDIFSKFTNLQLCVKSLVYAPILLQKVVKENYLEKFKACIAFAFSFSSVYLVMQKPFNPVLGQTFQAYIDNCPVYAEQISHHPPITAFLMVGRGYTISAQLQSKAFMSMNSGGGMNAGIMKFQFSDGDIIQFFGPWGQVTGIVYGERKFNLTGKCFGWIKKQNLMTQISINPFKGGLFSRNKKQSPSDYFEGPVYRTTNSYMDSLPAMVLKQKYKAPKKDDILSNQGKFNGIWHKIVKYQQQLILNIDNTYPCVMQYESAPLPSDANWRQDVVYRKLQQTSRCQKEKQIIQNIQRNDRKLRAANSKNKKH